MSLPANSIVILVISFIIVLCGVFIKKLARGRKLSPDQEWEDWFIGAELVFSSFTSAMFKALEIMSSIQGHSSSAGTISLSVIQFNKIKLFLMFLLFSIFILLVIMYIHRQGINWKSKSRTIMLGILENALGVMVVVALQFI